MAASVAWFWTRPGPEPEPVEVAVPDLVAPSMSQPSQAFVKTLRIELSCPPLPVGEIRFTLDGSVPTRESSLYTKPIDVADSIEITAAVFRFLDDPDQGEDELADEDSAVEEIDEADLRGPIARSSYVLVDSAAQKFESELPIVLIDTLGENVDRYRGRGASKPYVPAFFQVMEPGTDGLARLDSPASFSGRAGVRARGSSTLGRQKASLTVELQDHLGEDLEASLLGLPKESDWVLLGPWEFDRALIRNALIYRLTNAMGRYAPRTRFVEVFLNEDGGAIEGPAGEGEDYYGVYVLVEKIKRDRDRVAVEKMKAKDGQPVPLEGGYILKVDRPGPGDYGFYSGRQTFQFVYPKERRILPEQSAWIEEYLDKFHEVLKDDRSASGNYEEYLDVDAAIDYHIVNEFSKNPDSYVYSAYFHKAREGKLTLGPVWDFDRTMGCDFDRRARSPYGPSRNCRRFWYRYLFRDPSFRKRYRERWLELRKGPFAERAIFAVIDGMAEEIAEAAERNTARWGPWIRLRRGSWSEEIDELKEWISARLEWYDDAMPDFDR